ncbi:MAG: ATP synthase F1 subunit delta [Chitinophagales bacterium]|nr:ATP synthase F1 subunit delta [Chitinophagales bacterium]
MSEYRLASRYAKSLIDLAIEKDQLENVNKDVRYVASLIKEVKEFGLLLKSPIVNTETKNKIFSQLFDGKLDIILQTFLKLLIKKKREQYLPSVIEEFILAYNKYNKITPVYFTTAIPLEPETLNRLRELFVSGSESSNLEVHTEVDENIIGGFIFKYEDKMIDGSIRHQLSKMDDLFVENPYLRKYN